MTEEIKKPTIIRRKIKLPEQTENPGTSLKDQEVICDFIDCEEKECSHNEKHNKLEMMDACRIPCGIHKEAKCI